MNRNRSALIDFVDEREKWLDIQVPLDLTAQAVFRIKLFRQWRSFFIGLLKYATAETILILFLKSLAM